MVVGGTVVPGGTVVDTGGWVTGGAVVDGGSDLPGTFGGFSGISRLLRQPTALNSTKTYPVFLPLSTTSRMPTRRSARDMPCFWSMASRSAALTTNPAYDRKRPSSPIARKPFRRITSPLQVKFSLTSVTSGVAANSFAEKTS